MMLLVRLIDLLVRALQYLATPEARLLRAGLLVVLVCGALLAGAGLLWLLAQLPDYFTAPAAPTHTA